LTLAEYLASLGVNHKEDGEEVSLILTEAELTLAKYVTSLGVNCEGDGEEVSLRLAEAESTLAKCALLFVGYDRRECFLGKRIARYCMLMGQRGGDLPTATA
jgi:hypothetical protein